MSSKEWISNLPSNYRGVVSSFKCLSLELRLQTIIRELKQRRRRRQRERQQSSRFWYEKQQLCTCIMLFCTFFCRHCTTATWKCLFSHFMESVNTRERFWFPFLERRYSLLEFNSSKKVGIIWRIEREGICAVKFEAAWIHLFKCRLVPVAVVVA